MLSLLEKGGVKSYPSSLSFNISETVNFFSTVNWVDVVVEGCAEKFMELLTLPMCDSQSYFKTRQGKVLHFFITHSTGFSEGFFPLKMPVECVIKSDAKFYPGES